MHAAADVEQVVDGLGRVDRTRVDQLVVDARQLVRLHHDAHGALANIERAQVAVQRLRPLVTRHCPLQL